LTARQLRWHEKLRRRKKKWRKRGRAKIPSPQPPFFLPARAFSFGSAARRAAISRDFVQNGFGFRPTNTTKVDEHLIM